MPAAVLIALPACLPPAPAQAAGQPAAVGDGAGPGGQPVHRDGGRGQEAGALAGGTHRGAPLLPLPLPLPLLPPKWLLLLLLSPPK